MKIELMVIGRTASRYLQQGIEEYTKRLAHYVPFELTVLPDIKSTRALTQERQKQLEGEMFLSRLAPGDHLVLLDERGSELTSREFARFVDRKMLTVNKRMVVVVGGPYGFSQEMYDRAADLLSLSRMTFSHEMVRLFFVEQLYRAMTILRGEPYHHD